MPAPRIWRRGIGIQLFDIEDFGMAKKKDSLVVASKVRAYVKSKKMLTSSEALAAINDGVYCALDAAIARAKANRRSTVKAQDF